MHDPDGPLVLARGPVLLRDPHPGDLEAHVRWWTEETAWLSWDAPWEHRPARSVAEIRRECAARLGEPPARPRRRLALCARDGRLLGEVNRYPIEADESRIALGVDIRESGSWGRGLGREAFRLWAAYVFLAEGRKILYAETWSGNLRAVRLALGRGFREVARERGVRRVRGGRYDALRFSVTRERFFLANPGLPTTLEELAGGRR